jgi:proline dehydrogenase
MLRQTFLWLSHQQGIFRFVRNNGMARRFASRFVAGETIDDAVGAVRALNARKISASLDLLGESVTNAAEARATADHYVTLLDRIATEGLDSNVSVKLSGADISTLCIENITHVSSGPTRGVRPKGAAYTERRCSCSRAPSARRRKWGSSSSWRRTATDAAAPSRRLQGAGHRRLPTSVTSTQATNTEMKRPCCAAVPRGATQTRRSSPRPLATEQGSPATGSSSRCLRRAARPADQLREGGMRVYVPYGTQWYPPLAPARRPKIS